MTHLRYFVGDLDQDIGVARHIKSAVAREVPALKLAPRVLHGDRQAGCEQIGPVPTDGFVAAHAERVRIAPLRRPTHNNRSTRQPGSLTT